MRILHLVVSTAFIGIAAYAGAQSQPASKTPKPGSSAQMAAAAGAFSWKDFISSSGAQTKLPPVAYASNPQDSTCYSIRDYQFKRSANSGVMEPSGYSECAPASGFHLKEILTTHK